MSTTAVIAPRHVIEDIRFHRGVPSDAAPCRCSCGWSGQAADYQGHRQVRKVSRSIRARLWTLSCPCGTTKLPAAGEVDIVQARAHLADVHARSFPGCLHPMPRARVPA